MSCPMLKGIKNGKFSQGAHNLREEPGDISGAIIKWLRIMRISQQYRTKAWNKLDVLFQRKCQPYCTELLPWLMGNAIHVDLIILPLVRKNLLRSWSTPDRETSGLISNILLFCPFSYLLGLYLWPLSGRWDKHTISGQKLWINFVMYYNMVNLSDTINIYREFSLP